MSYLAERKINIHVKRTDRKSMKLTVRADGSVAVEAPRVLSEEQICKLIDDKKSWIISKVNQRLSSGNLYNNLKAVEGEKFSYLGRECTLRYQQTDSKKPSITVKNGQLIVSHHTNNEAELVQIIEKWYREKTKEEVEFWIKCYQPYFNVTPNRIVIKEQKRRWGSCSSKNNLNFNWRLSMMPTWVISYIVLHELCHFEEMNHSPAFWAAVEKRMPEYRKAKEWLKVNGHRFLPIE